MEEKKVLIVDDEKNIRMTLSQTLTGQGLITETAMNGEEALTKMDESKYDIIFLDLKMPGIHGLDVLKEISKSGSRIVTVIITAHGTIDSAVEAMKLGAIDFIQKPFTPDEIREVINTIMKRDELEAEKPDDFKSNIEYAKKCITEKNFESAINYLKKAISINSNSAEAYNMIGALLEIRGDLSEAQRNYRMALSVDPTYEPAEKNLERITSFHSNDSIIFYKNN
ncbi:MAG: response regulator [Candidatus Cloacimonetes bacterium]|nr:response regulator [Candidatus Cloacimonadota bacterium]